MGKQRFHTPSYFLNIRFTDVSAMPVFRGGVLRKYNRAILRTRRSEDRTADVYNEHCRDIIKAWESIVGKDGEQGLRTVWVLGALTTAIEAGFARPAVSLSCMIPYPCMLMLYRLEVSFRG